MEPSVILSPVNFFFCILFTVTSLTTIALHELTHIAVARLVIEGEVRVTHLQWGTFQIEPVETSLTPGASRLIAVAPFIIGACVLGLLVVTPGFATLRQFGGSSTSWLVTAHLILYSHLSPTDCQTFLWPET